MTKPITKFIDAVEIYFESGSVRIRFKEGVTLESLLDENIEKQQTLRTHPPFKCK
tara:strand:- start:261 stop:425 length:165 start_codon:yes stop_codon:yes gene_type:complete